MDKTVAIIPARGGSKGIPRKNLIDFCGRPLISWSILQGLGSRFIDSVWVTSDDAEILDISRQYGARCIQRPSEISGDTACTESALNHALDCIASQGIHVSLVVVMQPTSPIRESEDLDQCITEFHLKHYDSMLSVVETEDHFTWRFSKLGEPESVNYNYLLRKPRQELEKQYLENGSIYLVRPKLLQTFHNRLAGKIGMYIMPRYKMFQIDHPSDIRLCSAIMKSYILNDG
jgi:CMP-N,N'-diacetyllegionaminic acid synthase